MIHSMFISHSQPSLFVSLSVVLPLLSSPNFAFSISASATGWPSNSVLIVFTPDERLSVPNAPSTNASASLGWGRRLAPRRWTWIALGHLISRSASKSKRKVRPAVRPI